MPIYEYACTNCGHHLEAKQRLSDPALTLCPSCERQTLERLISTSSFALRGGGWYADGYGPGGKKDAAAATTPETTTAPAKADKPEKADKVESKPAAESKPATTSKPSE